MVFPAVMYGCESWTIKKAERQRISTFELWYWRRLLRVPWTARRTQGNQSWIFIRRTDAEAEPPILWPPDKKSWLTRKDQGWERSRARGDWGYRGWEGWMASSTQWAWIWASCGGWWTGRPGVLQSMGLQRFRHNWTTELNWTQPLSNWSVNLSSSSFSIYPEFLQACLNSTSRAALGHTVSHLT